MNQPQVYICPLPLEPPSHLPPLKVVTEHWAELPVSQGKFPLAIYFTYGKMYTFPHSFLSSTHPLFSPLCPQVCTLGLRLHCCPENRFISTIFLIPNTSINIRYLLYDLLCIIGSRFIHFIRIDSNAVYG